MEQEAEYNLGEPDIDFILQAVSTAKAQGLTPEQMLDPAELAVYQGFIKKNDRQEPNEHYANLVDMLDDTVLDRLAGDVINWVRWDEESRRDWSQRESEGIRALGVSDKVSGGADFEGSSKVVHPLLAEAIIQFHARAMAELWPPEGPVKSIVLGDKTPERLAQAERVQDYMNYLYTEDMPGAFEEEDKLLFRIGLSGSCFKKVYYDPIVKKLCSRLIEPADFIVPFSATDLETAPRYTHRYREMHNTVMKKIANGYYTKPRKLSDPNNETYEYPEVKDEIDHTEGRQRVGMDDQRHTLLETYVDLDLPGFEDKKEGRLTGVALPYIVTVNRDDQEVLRIQRNWKPTDENKNSKVCVSHYGFMPGLGFYYYGLLHLIGGLATSATGSIRALLDSAMFYNMQGGYKSRDARIKGGDAPIAPGEWREVDSSFEELKKAFFPLPYKEPSEVLFKLLGYLDERGQKLIGTTDVMTGDANPNAPVGTTLALIEQGGKNFSAVLRRLHTAHRNEFRIVARLNSEYIPEEGYPYYISKGNKNIFPADFDDRIDVIPVSDPNIISNSQRIVQAQAVMDLAEKHPDKVDITEAIKMMLQAIRIPNYEELTKVNEQLAQLQQKAQMLDIQIKEAELSKINAEKEKTDAEKTESVLRGMFTATQTANLVATNPLIAPMSDSLFKSAGGKDYNGLPLIDMTQANPMQLKQNTSPGFPANPEQINNAQPAPEQPLEPISPEQGANAGIETQRNETLQ